MTAARALRTFLGGLLLGIGTLIALSCGLCTGYFGLLWLGALGRPNSADTAPFLALGVVATAIGAGLVWAGVVLIRGAALSARDQPAAATASATAARAPPCTRQPTR